MEWTILRLVHFAYTYTDTCLLPHCTPNFNQKRNDVINFNMREHLN